MKVTRHDAPSLVMARNTLNNMTDKFTSLGYLSDPLEMLLTLDLIILHLEDVEKILKEMK